MKLLEKKRINKTVDKINNLKFECNRTRLYDARLPLEKINFALTNTTNTYTRKKAKMVNNCLKDISSHLTRDCIEQIKFDCAQACDIIAERYVVPSKSQEDIQKAKIKISELENVLRLNQSKFAEKTQQMDACLGKDEFTWKRLNYERKSIVNILKMTSKQFDSLLTHITNMETAECVRNLKEEYNSFIDEQQVAVDTDQFNEDISAIDTTCEESKRQQEIMGDSIYEHACNDNDEYRQALEAKNSKDESNKNARQSLLSKDSATFQEQGRY